MSETALHQAVTGGQDKEYLSFVLGDEHYALDITTVKEIRGYEQVTKIANAPAFIKGVINLRGDIVRQSLFVQSLFLSIFLTQISLHY